MPFGILFGVIDPGLMLRLQNNLKNRMPLLYESCVSCYIM